MLDASPDTRQIEAHASTHCYSRQAHPHCDHRAFGTARLAWPVLGMARRTAFSRHIEEQGAWH
jgi:hypothetical protein